MLPVGFGPTIPTSERPQTYALDRAATGTGKHLLKVTVFWNITPCSLVTGTNVTAKIYLLQDGIKKFISRVMKIRYITEQEATWYKCPLYNVPDRGRFFAEAARIHREFTASRRFCDISWTAWGEIGRFKIPGAWRFPRDNAPVTSTTQGHVKRDTIKCADYINLRRGENRSQNINQTQHIWIFSDHRLWGR